MMYDDLNDTMRLMKSIKRMSTGTSYDTMLNELMDDIYRKKGDTFSYEDIKIFPKLNETPVVSPIVLPIVQIKTMLLPMMVETIATGVEINLIEKISKFVKNVSDSYKINEKKNISFSIDTNKLKDLCNYTKNSELSDFLKSDIYESFRNADMAKSLIELYDYRVKDIVDSIDDNVHISNEMKVKDIVLEFTRSSLSDIDNRFLELDSSYHAMTQHNENTPIYVDLEEQVAYIVQKSYITYDVTNDDRTKFINAREQLKVLTNLIDFVISILKHKTYKGYIINDIDAKILKNIAKNCDAGFKFEYNNKKPEKSKLVFSENEKDSIIKLTHTGK